jgi:polynucleotide 5'-kinase involved in rRNA processing
MISLPWDDVNLTAAPVGAGTAFEIEPEVLQRVQGQRSGIIWTEHHGGELSVIMEAPLPRGTIADLERAVGLRIQTWLVAELHGTVLGLLDEAGEGLGIGVLRQLHFDSRRFEILTAEGIGGIRGLQWSRTRLEAGGELRRMPVAVS